MSGFQLYSSNRQEELIDHLARRALKTPLPDPLSTELIVVQHQGIQKWVSLELTNKLGILANTRFLFPNELAQIAFKEVVPGYQNTWDAEQLHWLLFDQLLSIPKDPEFDLLRGFQSSNKELKSFQLARHLSNLFDQYDMFRPEMIEEWELGKEQNWQASLYKGLPKEVRKWRKSKVLDQFRKYSREVNPENNNLPGRITFFGISYLPPLHLEVIKGLSQIIDVHFFFLNPSPHYWADLVPQKRILRESLKKNQKIKEDLHFEEGNVLLASWGKYGQEFFNSLYDVNMSQETEIFVEHADSENEGSASLLGQIQQDIYKIDSPERDQVQKGIKLPDGDNSIQIHSCHSPMREVEVLKDCLLMMFSKENNKPEEILVMTPDIDHYAPLIQSVFSSNVEEKNYIPYSITDRVLIRESIVIQYFLKLFEVAQSRYSINDLFSLMASRSIQEKFQLTDSDLILIKGWLGSVNVRWGIDAEFRSQKGVPATYENTWEFGIDRILTGFALPGHDDHLIKEQEDRNFILPFDHIEGNNALVFGRFLDFYDFVASLAPGRNNSVLNKRLLQEWGELFKISIEFLFKERNDWAEEFKKLNESISELITLGKKTEFDQPIGIDAPLDFFQNRFNGILSERGYIDRGVTFTAMKPMRSVPFKVIASIGMNDKAFPRSDKSMSFDLAVAKMPGDRSVKGEDRYLFLETLICTRKILYLSYIGRSIKDNSPLAPSALISELLDVIEQGYLSKDEIKKKILIDHPLQAFNPVNFSEGTAHFSFSDANLKAAKALLLGDKKLRSDLDLDLPEPGEEFNTVSLKNLVSFFDNPAKFLIYVRLKVYLEENQAEPEENEPFELDFIAKYAVEGDILTSLTHLSKEHTKQIIKSKGILPHNLAGERLFDDLYEDITGFHQEIESYINQPKLDPYPYDIQIGKFVLSGVLQTAEHRHLVRFRQSRVKVKDRVRIWIEHLVVNHLKPEGYPLTSLLIGKNSQEGKVEIYKMGPLKNPKKKLREFLEIYYSGLSKVLAFFPRSADTYMKSYLKSVEKDGDEIARQKARKQAAGTWEGHQNADGESENRYYKLFFEKQSLFADTNFESNLLKILLPVYENQIEEEV